MIDFSFVPNVDSTLQPNCIEDVIVASAAEVRCRPNPGRVSRLGCLRGCPFLIF